MITKKDIKPKIEGALENLHKADGDLRDAMSLIIGDTGNRIEIAGAQATLRQILAEVEDLIYDTEPDIDVYELLTKDDVKVARFSQVNSQI